jgi:Protein of unknown function (DUF3303)
MRFMVIEQFRHGPEPVYRRVREGGRLLPEGVRFVTSWVDESLSRCWQLMDADSAEALQPWLDAWADLVDFEVVPVLTSAEAADRALPEVTRRGAGTRSRTGHR